jgi:hypothetical protein
MPTINLAKNLEYIKKSEAKTKETIGIDAFKEIHTKEQSKHRNKQTNYT